LVGVHRDKSFDIERQRVQGGPVIDGAPVFRMIRAPESWPSACCQEVGKPNAEHVHIVFKSRLYRVGLWSHKRWADEYVKDGAGVQSTEAYFAILKRGVMGSFHSVSEQHLQRYLDEFAFRWNNRSALGVEDFERAAKLLKGAAGKRLTYRPSDKPETT
jgi:hypothetical protein